MMAEAEACHFPFFASPQNLRCEQLGESEAGAQKKISAAHLKNRDLFLGIVEQIDGGGG